MKKTIDVVFSAFYTNREVRLYEKVIGVAFMMLLVFVALFILINLV